MQASPFMGNSTRPNLAPVAAVRRLRPVCVGLKMWGESPLMCYILKT